MKSEPDECSIDDVLAARRPHHRRGAACATTRRATSCATDMSVGDGVLFYHSSCPEPGIAGLAEVASAAVPGQNAVRSEERLLRPGVEARSAALVQRRRARAEEDPAGVACRNCKKQKPLAKMVTLRPGQPSVDHAGDRGGMEAHHHQAALKNDTFLRALARQPTDYTPIWLMRQAGRYLPEYNATRARGRQLPRAGARRPSFATEVTLQPLERFPLDAAILFSDILTIPDAMGLGLSFAEGEGPRFERPLRDEAAIRKLARAGPVRGAALRARRGARRSGSALAEPRAADRLLRQPVHARLLHGRRRAAATTGARQDHAACAARPAAPDSRGQRPRGERLPERADRRGRPGGR